MQYKDRAEEIGCFGIASFVDSGYTHTPKMPVRANSTIDCRPRGLDRGLHWLLADFVLLAGIKVMHHEVSGNSCVMGADPSLYQSLNIIVVLAFLYPQQRSHI